MNDLIIKIRALAVELSARGIHAGHIEAGTQRRAAELNRQLVALFNTELEVTETGQRLPTLKGVILKSMIQHVVAAGFGARSHSQTQREERILSAAKALPELCDKLESKPDTLVPAPVGANIWKQAREQNPELTVSDQMQTLFIKDDSIVDRKNLSGVVAGILGCSDSAVRSRNNAAWKFYRTEQEKRKKLRKELKNKRSVDSEQNDADE